MLGQRAVEVGSTERSAHVAVETQVVARAVQLTVEGDIATTRNDALGLRGERGNQACDLSDLTGFGIQVDAIQVKGLITAASGHRETAPGIQRQAAIGRVNVEHGELDAVPVAHDIGSDAHGFGKILELRQESLEVRRRNCATGRADAQGHLRQFIAQFLQGRVLEMHVIETDVTARQFHLHVLDVHGVVGDVDVG